MRQTLPLMRMTPDDASVQGGGIVLAQNVVPAYNSKFLFAGRCVLDMEDLGTTLDGPGSGLTLNPTHYKINPYYHPTNVLNALRTMQGFYFTVGDSTFGNPNQRRILFIEHDDGPTANAVTDVTPGAGFITVVSKERPSWTSYGPTKVVMTPGYVVGSSGVPVLRDANGVAATFEPFITTPASPPIPKYITTAAGRLVAGNLKEGGFFWPQRVWACAADDETKWDPVDGGSWFEMSNPHGEITSIKGLDDSLVVFQERAVFYMSYTGGTTLWQKFQIGGPDDGMSSEQLGAPVVVWGRSVYYLSHTGWKAVDYGGQIRKADEGFRRFFFGQLQGAASLHQTDYQMDRVGLADAAAVFGEYCLTSYQSDVSTDEVGWVSPSGIRPGANDSPADDPQHAYLRSKLVFVFRPEDGAVSMLNLDIDKITLPSDGNAEAEVYAIVSGCPSVAGTNEEHGPFVVIRKSNTGGTANTVHIGRLLLGSSEGPAVIRSGPWRPLEGQAGAKINRVRPLLRFVEGNPSTLSIIEPEIELRVHWADNHDALRCENQDVTAWRSRAYTDIEVYKSDSDWYNASRGWLDVNIEAEAFVFEIIFRYPAGAGANDRLQQLADVLAIEVDMEPTREH